jgi:riboflavin biosynthesis pyrimidine reductase
LRVPESARVFRTARGRVRLYTQKVASEKAQRLLRRGVAVRRGGRDRPGSLRKVLEDLAGSGIQSVLIEGGARVAARALRERLVDRLVVFVAMKLVGEDGHPMIARLGRKRMKDALPLHDVRIERVGEDLLIEARPSL